jgi:transposase
MWQPYLRLIRKNCPQALNILDRFHIVAKMNDSLGHGRANIRPNARGRTKVGRTEVVSSIRVR